MRIARPADIPMLQPLIQAGYPGQEWTEQDVEQRLREAGVHRVDPDRLAYLHLIPHTIAEPQGPIPAGLCTQVASLLPQHHDEGWIRDVLSPLLVKGLKVVAKEYPTYRNKPVYAYLSKELLELWTPQFNAETTPRSTGAYIGWLPTLQEAIRKVNA